MGKLDELLSAHRADVPLLDRIGGRPVTPITGAGRNDRLQFEDASGHAYGAEDVTRLCWEMGPRVGSGGAPRCVLEETNHGGKHRADLSWAPEVTTW